MCRTLVCWSKLGSAKILKLIAKRRRVLYDAKAGSLAWSHLSHIEGLNELSFHFSLSFSGAFYNWKSRLLDELLVFIKYGHLRLLGCTGCHQQTTFLEKQEFM